MVDEGDNEQDPALKAWKQHEATQEESALRATLKDLTEGPQKTCLHRTFSFLSFLMGMTGLLMLIGQLVGLYFYELDPIQGVMRCYVCLMCFIVILNELEWFNFIRESAILRIWITRGIFYSFVGVLGLVEIDTEKASHHTTMQGQGAALKFIEVVAYMMVACGMLYFAMGCLCLQILRNRVMADYDQRSAEVKANNKKVQLREQGSII